MNQFNNFNPALGMINNPTQPMQQPVMEMRNELSNEEMAQLRQSGVQTGSFFKAPTQIETLKAICSHKNGAGQLSIHPIGDDKFKCDICGEEFSLVDEDDTQVVEAACNKVNDIFQTIKTFYGATNPNLRNVYPCINVIKQLPQMFKHAYEYFKAAVPQNNNNYYGNGYYTPSNVYASATAGADIPGMVSNNYGYGNYGGGYNSYPQPYYGNPQQFQQPSPMMGGQPAYPQNGYNQQAPAYGYPQPTQPQNTGINYQQPVQTGYNAVTPTQSQMQNPQPYPASANPIGTVTPVQPQTAPATNNVPTNTANVNVGTKPIQFEA